MTQGGPMGFGEAVAVCFRRFATFRGRSRRREFWWFQLLALLTWIPTVAVATVLWAAAFEGSLTGPTDDPAINPDAVRWAPLTAALGAIVLYLVVIGLPGLAVTARRLHDIGQGAPWLLLAAVGLGVVLFAMAVIEGQRGSNRYGPDPRLTPARVESGPAALGSVAPAP